MVKEKKKKKNLLNSAQCSSNTKKEKTVEATPLHTLSLTHSLQRCIQKILMNSIKKFISIKSTINKIKLKLK